MMITDQISYNLLIVISNLWNCCICWREISFKLRPQKINGTCLNLQLREWVSAKLGWRQTARYYIFRYDIEWWTWPVYANKILKLKLDERYLVKENKIIIHNFMLYVIWSSHVLALPPNHTPKRPNFKKILVKKPWGHESYLNRCIFGRWFRIASMT